jgi:uncharacterized protein (TIGR03437 family)
MKNRSAPFLILFLIALGTSLQAASTIYMATDLGPYKSTDSGATWAQLTVEVNNPFAPSGPPHVNGIAVDPTNPSTVYFVGEAFYKSTDGGQTWSAVVPVGFTFGQNTPGGTLAIDPVMTNVIYTTAYTPDSNAIIVKSTDAGVTFAPITNVPNGVSAVSICTDPSISGVLYAVGGEFVFKSSDFGNTWSQIASHKTTGAAIFQIFIDPSNGQTIFAISNAANCGPPSGAVCGLLKTSNGGGSWAPVNLAANEVDSVAFDTSSGAIYAGAVVTGLGVTAVKSTDGGNTWTPLYNKFNGGNAPLIVAVDPNINSTVYVLQGGFWESTDSGASWSVSQIPPGCDSYVKGCAEVNAGSTYFVVATAAPAPPPPPSISASGVANGASFQPGIVPNSWVTIAGTNLASQTDNWSNAIVNGKFPTKLDDVSVTIGGDPAYIYFISPRQINLLAPDVGFGSLPVIVTTAGGASATLMVTSNEYGPAFFEWPNNQPVATRQDFTDAVQNGTFPGTTTVAAKPGDVIILWGTGFGPTKPVAPPGAAVPSNATYSTTTLPTVTIDNISAMVYGAALAPGFAGLYQVAIQVPASIPNGNWPIQASIGGVQSPAGVLLSVQQ